MTIAQRIGIMFVGLLLAVAGTAAAQTAHGDWRAEADDALAGGEYGVYGEDRYADLDAGAMTEDAAAVVDTDASYSTVDEANEGSVWTWFEIRFSAVVDAVRDLVGLDVPHAVDANAEVYASDDGVDLDANLDDWDFDGSEIGDVDGLTWKAVAEAKATVGPS